jgi:tetratricopeptide (TPR) repeat protein
MQFGRLDKAAELQAEALHLARAVGARYPEVEALIGLALSLRHSRRQDDSLGHAELALAMASEAEYRVLEGGALVALAEIHLDRGDHAEANRYATRALAVHRSTGYRLGEARALSSLGRAARKAQRQTAALAYWQAALHLFADLGVPEADRVRRLMTAVQRGR